MMQMPLTRSLTYCEAYLESPDFQGLCREACTHIGADALVDTLPQM